MAKRSEKKATQGGFSFRRMLTDLGPMKRLLGACFAAVVASKICLAFIFCGNMVSTPLSTLASAMTNMQNGLAAFERIYEFLDVNAIMRQGLRSQFGIVLQDSWVFTGTIAENISYGKPNASREEVESAAARAGCPAFIEKLPQGFDAMVSEESSALSAGEKQLLCIARTILSDPKILILVKNRDGSTLRVVLAAHKAMSKQGDLIVRGPSEFIMNVFDLTGFLEILTIEGSAA